MIIWNCQTVNSSNSALKPLQRLPNVPKVSYVWDILIFQAPVTFRFTEESHGDYLQLEHIGQHWRNLMEIHTFWLSISSSISFNCLQSQIGLMIFSSWSGGPIFIKFQNVPYIRNFWHIWKPWERFQCWVRRVYFWQFQMIILYQGGLKVSQWTGLA